MKPFFKKIAACIILSAILFGSTLAAPKNIFAQENGDAFVGPRQTDADTFVGPQQTDADAFVGPQQSEEEEETSGCGITNLTRCFIDAILFIPGQLAIIVLQFADYLVWLSGALLNFAVQYSVVDMKENIEKAGSVNNAWRVVRDLSNMAFIFVLLYAAIQTIIGQGKDTKGLIVRIVMVGVLMNFSLFFTKFVIDVSNILAITFYDAIAPGALSESVSGGISNVLMEPLQLTTIYKSVEGGGLNGTRLFIVGIMGTILALIAAFVFFAVAIMFIIRFVVLMIVLVLSPIAFIASILPQAEEYRRDWWNALSGQAFFAPIYFMLTWVVIVLSRGVLTNEGSLATVVMGITGPNGEARAPSPSDVGIMVNFIILIVMMISSLLIAKKWADKTPGGMSKLTGWAMGAAGSTTLGVAGRFGRGTFGRVGQQIADSEYLKSKPDSLAARLTLAAGRKTAGTSFDMRNAGFAGQLGAGKGQKGGFAKDMEEKIKEEKKYADSFKPSDLVVAKAERDLAESKKSGTPADIARAQAALDKISGVNEDALRQRKLKELRAQGLNKKQARERLDRLEDERLQEINRLTTVEGWTQERAEKEATAGWAPKPEKGLANERKEAYAKDRESGDTTIGIGKYSATIPHFSVSGRVLAVGKIKKERQAVANAIRKSIKEKKPADKLAEELSKAQDAADGAGGTAPEPAPEAGGAAPTAGGVPTTS